MDFADPYISIILVTFIIILSFLFNAFSEKTNIPSVLLLIVTGIVIKQVLQYSNEPEVDEYLFMALEYLGIVGLIMIVLEAALDLELTMEKWPTIWKAFVVALLGLVVSTVAAAYIFMWFMDNIELRTALLYATPISILSSAIIIPSVSNLVQAKKEFHIYESTFSDILGIMQFYFLVGLMENSGVGGEGKAFIGFLGSSLATIAISVVASYLLIFLFQNIRSHVKLFLLISILILLYAVGKTYHLSSLIIILIFGLVLSNSHLFFRGFLKKYLKKDVVKHIEADFHIVTIESAFVVRTFFFVVFGMTLPLSSLLDVQVLLVSSAVLASIYLVRLIFLRAFVGKAIVPQVYIAPRGLVTVLLFFSIPESLKNQVFDQYEQGILLFVIIATSVIMALALISDGRKRTLAQQLEQDPLIIPPDQIYKGFQNKWNQPEQKTNVNS